MRTIFSFLLLCCLSLTFAVDAPTIAKRDQPIVVDHAEGETINAIFGSVEGGSFVWKFLPDAHFIRTETKTYLAAPPGEYIIIVGESRIIKVVEEGSPDPPKPKPDPKPDPRPDPKPDPQPDAIQAEWLIWIEEVQDRTKHLDQTSTMLSTQLRKTLDEIGLKVRVYDDDQPEALSYLRLVGDKRPALIILGKVPGEYRVFDAPSSVEEAEKLIRRAIVR